MYIANSITTTLKVKKVFTVDYREKRATYKLPGYTRKTYTFCIKYETFFPEQK